MFCPRCATELNDDEIVCRSCGFTPSIFKDDFGSVSDDNLSEKADKANLSSTRSYLPLPGITEQKNLFPIAAAAFLAVVVLTAVLIHINSDSYKIKKAAQLVCNYQYSGAINKLSEVYSPQAEIIRDYIDVLEARDNFLEEYSANGIEKALIDNDYAYIVDAAAKFRTELRAFEENENLYLLPSVLRTQFEYYIDVCDSIDKLLYDEGLYSMCYNTQRVFLNEPIRQMEDEFTLQELQNNINLSESGVQKLNQFLNEKVYDFSNSGQKFDTLRAEYCPDELRGFYELTYDLIIAGETKIEEEQKIIDQYKEEFDMDDRLHFKYTDPDYTEFVCDGLKELADESDASYNANALANTFSVNMLKYCLQNS